MFDSIEPAVFESLQHNQLSHIIPGLSPNQGQSQSGSSSYPAGHSRRLTSGGKAVAVIERSLRAQESNWQQPVC